MTRAILGLGSNTGDRLANLAAAITALRILLEKIQISSIYASEALLKPGAPEAWNKPFLNMVCLGEYPSQPEHLLAHCQQIEQALGKTSAPGSWAPRAIDIDILAFGDRVVNTPILTIPHPHMQLRPFVLLPLAEIAPGWRHPHLQKTAAELASTVVSDSACATRKTDYSLNAN